MQGMWMMLQVDTPDDFVLATGETHPYVAHPTLINPRPNSSALSALTALSATRRDTPVRRTPQPGPGPASQTTFGPNPNPNPNPDSNPNPPSSPPQCA